MSLSSYLAQKYLTASKPASTKKRKRKHAAASTTGLIIADEDDALNRSLRSAPGHGLDDDDGDHHMDDSTVAGRTADFRKTKKSAWKVVGAPALQPRADLRDDNDDNDAAAADAIVAAAERERKDAGAGGDDAGALVVDAPFAGGDGDVVKMGDGTHAGLQRAGDVKRQFEKRKREELEAWETEERTRRGDKAKKGADAVEEETVYRDATGRRIDLTLRRQEKRRELAEQERQARAEKEAQRGDVQLAQRERRREELDEARFMPVARGVDDAELNRELKERDRWDDPAMRFLKSKKAGTSATGKPLYQGAAAPNRYGIRPGHGWDGVDRGNGWEAERFKAINRRERNKDLGYAWEMDT